MALDPWLHEDDTLVKQALYGSGEESLDGLVAPSEVALRHSPGLGRSLSSVQALWPASYDEHKDLTECIAAWQETGGRTFPDFGRIVSRSPGSTQRLQENEAGRSELFGPALVLNVGGTLFRTTPSTLRKAPFFDSMLRHTVEGGFGATVDSEGHYFVDRSGFLFRYVLEYLRTGFWLLGEKACDLEFIDAIRAEASFYGLEGNQQLPVPRITEYVSVWQHKDDTSIYVDCLEQTIREERALHIRKPFLLLRLVVGRLLQELSEEAACEELGEKLPAQVGHIELQLLTGAAKGRSCSAGGYRRTANNQCRQSSFRRLTLSQGEKCFRLLYCISQEGTGAQATKDRLALAVSRSPVRGAGFDASPETGVQDVANAAADNPDQRSSRLKNGWHDSTRPSEWSERELKEQLDLQRELEEKEKQLQWQQQQLLKQFDSASGQKARDDERRSEPGLQRGLLPASSSWNLPENNMPQGAQAAARRTLHHSPSAPEFASAGQEKTGPSSSRSTGLHGRTTSRQQRSVTPDAPRRHPVRAAAEQEVSASLRVPSSGKHVPKLEREAPVHIRLYQEKDDRRRRLEQARLRRLEQEEEDLRVAAERALGRQPSPARPRRDPSPGKMLLGPSPSGGPSSACRTDSPARRARPPIPDRPGSAGRSRHGTEGVAKAAGTRWRKTGLGDRTQKQESEPNDTDPMLPAGLETSSIASVASDSGAVCQHSLVSVGTGVEDSVCGEAATSAGQEDEVQRLRHMVSSQQQRTCFAESCVRLAIRTSMCVMSAARICDA
ncbi:kctd6 [Symbiodinium sp. CCMP2592]|nr:kctd6 [Symbiodinium sp. CCMP2592]